MKLTFKSMNWFEIGLLLAILSLAIISFVIKGDFGTNAWVAAIAAILGVFCVVLGAKGSLANWFFGIVEAVLHIYICFCTHIYGDMLQRLFYNLPMQFIFYSLAIYFLYLLGGYVVFMALPQTASLPFIAALILYIFGSVGMMVTPGGIGLYPVLVWQALTIFAVSQEAGLACGWILWGSQQLVVLVLGMFYLVKFSLLRKKKNTSEEKSLT